MAEDSYQQFCPVAMAAEILCKLWTVLVLREMIAGSRRFNDLRRGVPRMSPALLWQFSIPVLAANLVAWPVAWYYLRHWLESFAYRISLNPLYFLAGGVVALAIAWATVIGHTVLTARASPIHELRYE